MVLNDGPVLRTTYTVYDREFPDGQREICITRSTLIRQTSPLAMPGRAKRGESTKREANDDDSAKRAKQAVRLRCKAIGADRMITLNYRENMIDMEKLKKDWKAFCRRMGKCKAFQYVATFERQERGAWHIHVAVHGRQSYQLVRSIWQSVIGKAPDGRSGGAANVRDPHKFGFGRKGQHKLASYIAKYIIKNSEYHDLDKKRYWTSRGIVVPEKKYWSLPYGVDFPQACAHGLEMALGHRADGVTFFANQGLGVFWAATTAS
jgi:hypothetical protein